MKLKGIRLIVALCMFVIGVIIVLLVGSSTSDPNDSVLIKTFKSHEPEFQKLVGMAGQDSTATIISNSIVCFSALETGGPQTYLHRDKPRPASDTHLDFPELRWREYSKLFENLGLKGGLYRKGALPEGIFFAASVRVIELDNDEAAIVKKGYVYIPNSIRDNLTGNLDNIQINRPAIFYKRIQDDWYLFYEWSVSKPE